MGGDEKGKLFFDAVKDSDVFGNKTNAGTRESFSSSVIRRRRRTVLVLE